MIINMVPPNETVRYSKCNSMQFGIQIGEGLVHQDHSQGLVGIEVQHFCGCDQNDKKLDDSLTEVILK